MRAPREPKRYCRLCRVELRKDEDDRCAQCLPKPICHALSILIRYEITRDMAITARPAKKAGLWAAHFRARENLIDFLNGGPAESQWTDAANTAEESAWLEMIDVKHK